jgi:hypothetical protein
MVVERESETERERGREREGNNVRATIKRERCESVTQVRSRKAHLRCATDAREANGAQLLRSAPSCACGFSAIALLLNLENSLFRTNSNNLRRIESCTLNINLRCPNFTHSLMIHPSYK